MADDVTFAFGEIWNLLDSRGMGGIESHVGELAAGLRDAGQRPRVLFLADHGPHPLRDRLDREGLPWEALAGGFGALYARLKAGRPGVLHTHGYKANLFGRIAARLLGIPVVASYHAGEAPPGMLGLETCLPLLLGLVQKRRITATRVIESLTTSPAVCSATPRWPAATSMT